LFLIEGGAAIMVASTMLLPQYQQNLEDKTVPKFLLGDGS